MVARTVKKDPTLTFSHLYDYMILNPYLNWTYWKLSSNSPNIKDVATIITDIQAFT